MPQAPRAVKILLASLVPLRLGCGPQVLLVMNPTTSEGPGWAQVFDSVAGYSFSVPRALPPDLEPTWELTERLSAADRALSELAGLARNLPNPHLLIRPFVRREAVLSSRIEGTQASLSDLFLFEAAPATPRAPDVLEVRNYVRALELGLVSELPVSLRMIRQLHETLMMGTRGRNRAPGEFRRAQNWIGPEGRPMEEATYVPPRPPEMLRALNEFEAFLHQPSPLPPLIRLAMIHYQFEAIHPFLDGNGRVGRLLVPLLMCREELLPKPLLYLSAYLEQRRQQYYDLLSAVSFHGAWSEWIAFFLEGVETQSKDALWRTEELLSLWRDYRSRFESPRTSALLPRLVDALFETPAITIPTAARYLDVTPRTANLHMRKLEEAGIVAEVTDRPRNKVFLAAEVLRLTEMPKPPETGGET